VRTIVITIGDEIIEGAKVDTNSAYLASSLGRIGIEVSRIASVGDDVEGIVAVLEEASQSYDLVLVTGGLGPTHDDVTRLALARVLGKKLVPDEAILAAIEERFRRRGLKAPADIAGLAMVPEGARAIANPAGTAPGLAALHGKAQIYVLPGVPGEVRAIFEGGVGEELKGAPGRKFILARAIRTVGITESDISAKLSAVDRKLKAKLAYLPEETGVVLSIRAASSSEAEALSALDEATSLIAAQLGDRIYSTAGEDLYAVVGRLLIDRGKTIAVAESCTGGLVAHLLTEVPGISACFERGVVAYSNQAKIEALGVAPELLAGHGAVSAEVAVAMARGVRETAGCDLGLSTTGIAGPGGGSEAKPVGLVYMALAHEAGVEAVRHVFPGTRHAIKLRAAVRALDMVRCHMLGEGSGGAGGAQS